MIILIGTNYSVIMVFLTSNDMLYVIYKNKIKTLLKILIIKSIILIA